MALKPFPQITVDGRSGHWVGHAECPLCGEVCDSKESMQKGHAKSGAKSARRDHLNDEHPDHKYRI